MNKKLEEAIKWLENNIKYYQKQIEFIEILNSDYYDEEYELYKKRIETFKVILNYIENSIPKEVIEKKIEELENSQAKVKNNKLIYSREDIFRFQIYILEELLD